MADGAKGRDVAGGTGGTVSDGVLAGVSLGAGVTGEDGGTLAPPQAESSNTRPPTMIMTAMTLTLRRRSIDYPRRETVP